MHQIAHLSAKMFRDHKPGQTDIRQTPL